MAAHTDSIILTCPICKRDHSAPLTRRIDIDAGLDDRLVEICKGLALSQFPASETCYVTDIRYDTAGGQEVLHLTLSDGTEDFVLGFDSLYQQVFDRFDPALPPLRGGSFALVDLDHAAALMRGFEEV